MKQFIIGLVLSIGALWVAFRDLNWQEFGEAISQGNLFWILVASVLLLSAIPLRAIRWKIFLQPVTKVPVRLTSEATIIGYFGNNVLPFRLGELLRSYFVARQTSSSISRVFGTVIVERIVDILSTLLLVLILPFTGVVPDALQQPIVWLVVISFVVAIATIWLVNRKEGIPLVKGRLKQLLDNLHLGFKSLRQRRHYFALGLSTIGIWVLYLTYIHVAQYAMGFRLSLAESYLVLVTTTLVLLIPAAPGFVGTFHAAVVLAFVNILAEDPSQSQAMAVVLHALGFIPNTILGSILYFRSHLRFKEVRNQQPVLAGEKDHE
jgi:uncharacterized protein (TIRG00374 family)